MTWKGGLVFLLIVAALAGAVNLIDPSFVPGLRGMIPAAETPGPGSREKDEHGEHDAAEAEEFERGPHNGRLLKSGRFALEVTIFETGVPPEFHFYPYMDDRPLDPAKVAAEVKLSRLGGEVDTLSFEPQADYLKSTSSVVEPHSFDVAVSATHDGKTYAWTYGSYEGRTTITEAAASGAGMETETAGPVTIEETITLTGSVVLNQNKTAQVKARFPGVVRQVSKNVGEMVKQGEVLAVVESNTSLNNYDVTAPFDGVLLERNTNIGDVTGDAAIFVVADLSSVWAEFHVFSKDLPRIKAGQTIRVKDIQGDSEVESTVAIFTPVAELASQSILARVTLDNTEGRWRPGMTVRGLVVVDRHKVPLAVKSSALQRFRDFTVVFAKVGTTYEVRMLDLGVSDATWTEVKGGLKPGTEYVAENSFLVKADIEKSGASHDH